MANKGDLLCIALTVFTLFVSVFLLAFSFDTLDPQDAAFLYNANTMKIDTTELWGDVPGKSGRKFTGLGQEFKWRFPRNQQSILFGLGDDPDASAVTCLSKEGASIQVSIAYQYTLPMQKELLYNLFLKFGTDYQTYLVRYSRSTIRDVMSQFEVIELYESRAAIHLALHDALSAKLIEHDVTLHSLQLLSMFLPAELQTAIETTSVFFQGIQEARFEQDAERVRTATDVLVAVEEAKILGLEANATAAATLLTARANADAITLSVGAEAETLKVVKEALSLTTSADLLTYVWMDVVSSSAATRRIMGIKPPASMPV